MLLAASASVCFNLLASVHFDLHCANGSMAISTPDQDSMCLLGMRLSLITSSCLDAVSVAGCKCFTFFGLYKDKPAWRLPKV